MFRFIIKHTYLELEKENFEGYFIFFGMIQQKVDHYTQILTRKQLLQLQMH